MRVWLDIGKTCFIIIMVNMQFFLLCRKVLWGNLQERDHLEELDIAEDNITMYYEGVGWGHGLD